MSVRESLKFYGMVGFRKKFPEKSPADSCEFVNRRLDAYRAEVLREAAEVADKFTDRWPSMDDMKSDGIIGPHTMAGALADEFRRMAEEAQP